MRIESMHFRAYWCHSVYEYAYLLISWPVEAGILVTLSQTKQEVQAKAKQVSRLKGQFHVIKETVCKNLTSTKKIE